MKKMRFFAKRIGKPEWQAVSSEGQSEELKVVEQLVSGRVIVAQMWLHNGIHYSLNLYNKDAADEGLEYTDQPYEKLRKLGEQHWLKSMNY
ncbi:hypothetical protein [Paenibacillus sp. Y412MC10]|uniref:hypothetical protein n=1 Tax=Geobacillus sp. (strain Y412MC10) TaxID=481743 RepID=UPI0011A88101|nr:hypothetical protein [Paenibacillus sp. Y412MC10]